METADVVYADARSPEHSGFYFAGGPTGMTLSFFIPGHPRPAGSKNAWVPTRKGSGEPFRSPGGRIVVNVVDSAGKGLKEWRRACRDVARLFTGEASNIPAGTPLAVHFLFWMPRPKGHFRSNGELKPGAPEWHTIKPDALKLGRGTEDSLTGIIWADDSSNVSVRAEKIYCGFHDRPGCMVTIRSLEKPATPATQPLL